GNLRGHGDQVPGAGRERPVVGVRTARPDAAAVPGAQARAGRVHGQRPGGVAGQYRDVGAVVVGDDQVRAAVGVEVADGDAIRVGAGAGRVVDGGCEHPGPGVAQDTDGEGTVVGDGQIAPPVPVEVGRGDATGIAAGRVAGQRAERAVPVAQ